MIVPGANIGVTDYVVIAGVPAAPASITAVLYRWVGATRSASGVTVTVSPTATVGEYKFTWTNSADWGITDDLELVALPVVDDVTYPAVVWRSYGDVNYSSAITAIAAKAELITAEAIEITSNVQAGGTISVYIGDDDTGSHPINIPVVSGASIRTLLQTPGVQSIFGAGRTVGPIVLADLVTGTVLVDEIAEPDTAGKILIPVEIRKIDKGVFLGDVKLQWQLRVLTEDGERTIMKGPFLQDATLATFR